MTSILASLSELQLVLLVFAVFTGLTQLALFIALATKGGRITIWWGVCSAVLFAAVILL